MVKRDTPSVPDHLAQFLGDLPLLTRRGIHAGLQLLAHDLLDNPLDAARLAQLVVERADEAGLTGILAGTARIGNLLRAIAHNTDPTRLLAQTLELGNATRPDDIARSVRGDRPSIVGKQRYARARRASRPLNSIPTLPDEINRLNITETVLTRPSVTAAFARTGLGRPTDNDVRLPREINDRIVASDDVPYRFQEAWSALTDKLALAVARFEAGELTPANRSDPRNTQPSRLPEVRSDLIETLELSETIRLRQLPTNIKRTRRSLASCPWTLRRPDSGDLFSLNYLENIAP